MTFNGAGTNPDDILENLHFHLFEIRQGLVREVTSDRSFRKTIFPRRGTNSAFPSLVPNPMQQRSKQRRSSEARFCKEKQRFIYCTYKLHCSATKPDEETIRRSHSLPVQSEVVVPVEPGIVGLLGVGVCIVLLHGGIHVVVG